MSWFTNFMGKRRDLKAQVSDIICRHGFDVVKESFYLPRRSKLCHSSCDLLLWNFSSWFQVRVAPTPPQLYRHPSLVLLIKWRGSHKAAERAWIFISEVDQTSLCLPACLSAYLSACTSLHFWGCISVFQPVCLRVCLSHLSVRLPARSPCLSSRPRPSTCLYLPVCLHATWPACCLWSFSERDWLADRPLGWLELPTAEQLGHTCTHTHA